MATMRDKYGDLLVLTPHGWKYVDENDFEEPRRRRCQDVRGWCRGPEDEEAEEDLNGTGAGELA